mmetsp:Transcript_8339/g.23905  ORF Transcript_8339/g.23905 Transcript_8339/m.23905 type:complete len:412 (-) Transcript_8339:144-1379(-)
MSPQERRRSRSGRSVPKVRIIDTVRCARRKDEQANVPEPAADTVNASGARAFYVGYVLEVRASAKRWRTVKRYSSIRAFARRIMREHEIRVPVPCPGKALVCSVQVGTRRQQLEWFLRALFSEDGVIDLPESQKFLEFSDSVLLPPNKAKASPSPHRLRRESENDVADREEDEEEKAATPLPAVNGNQEGGTIQAPQKRSASDVLRSTSKELLRRLSSSPGRGLTTPAKHDLKPRGSPLTTPGMSDADADSIRLAEPSPSRLEERGAKTPSDGSSDICVQTMPSRRSIRSANTDPDASAAVALATKGVRVRKLNSKGTPKQTQMRLDYGKSGDTPSLVWKKGGVKRMSTGRFLVHDLSRIDVQESGAGDDGSGAASADVTLVRGNGEELRLEDVQPTDASVLVAGLGRFVM